MTRASRRRKKQRKMLLISITIMLLLAIAIPGCKKILNKAAEAPITEPADEPSNQPEKPEPNEPETEPKENVDLEPVPVKPALPGVFIASIDNKEEARPQSGMDKADMVIEIIAEGGITRYMAFFYKNAAPLIGPIRSAREYFVQIAKAYNSPLAHAGGSAKALQLIADLKIPDLDEIYNSGPAFWRDNSRYAPHNLYTSTERLLKEAQRRGLKITAPPELPTGSMPAGTAHLSVSISYSQSYKVTWQWQNDKYQRYINGKPHVMKDGAKLSADNIVIIAAAHRDVVTDVLRTDIDIIGSGVARFLRDGQVYHGTWKKASASDHFEFMVDGQPFKFKEGVTWIQVVPSMNAVVVQ